MSFKWQFIATSSGGRVLIVVASHQMAHDWTAWYLGNDIAKRLKTLVFNPLEHAHFCDTITLTALPFLDTGGVMMSRFAKSVPGNFFDCAEI